MHNFNDITDQKVKNYINIRRSKDETKQSRHCILCELKKSLKNVGLYNSPQNEVGGFELSF